MVKLLLLVLLLLLVGWLILRRRSTAAPVVKAANQERRSNKQGTAYHAVSIKFPENACFPAKALHGRRFLASAAPSLPLRDCDASECRCRFVHHQDRRGGKDRRSPFGASGIGGATGRYEKERREGKDRRDDVDPDLF